jgi:type IX secretion system substrate protein
LIFDFAAGDNGLGKAYTFNPQLCGSLHTLPARLSTFTGQGIEKKVLLNWKTTAEENLSNYVIEKSTDGTNFTTMGYVFAKNGSGVNEYDMIDYKPVTGMNYYRLRLVNNDNSFTYSSVIKIKFSESTFNEISIVPNPVSANYKVKLTGLEKGTYTLQIRNSQGQFVLARFIEITQGEYSVNMTKTGAMSPGIYFMHVMNNHNSQVKIAKFIVK